ncbi:MAG: endo alpha-1,4 polygalactosaminidase [Gaiellales bacterium]
MRALRPILLACLLGVTAPAAAGAVALPPPTPCPGCWHPAVQTTWQWQLGGKLDPSIDVRMYDVDMVETSPAQVAALHATGRKVICYISAGSWEAWRPDARRFPASVRGRPLDGWPGERWLDIRKQWIIGPLMRARMDRCRVKGFDGVEFDNVDAYTNHTGFALTDADQLRYDAWLANQAHQRGLMVLLKNDLGQITNLLPYFDGALNEQCFQYRECGNLRRFVAAGKPVFEVEYGLPTTRFCPAANHYDFNSLRKRLPLGPWRIACR